MKTEEIQIIDTKMLFGNKSNMIEILHNGVIYVLRITKEGKLILTK